MKLICYILFWYSTALFAQNCGEIKGIVYRGDSTEIIPFALVKLCSLTDTFGVISDINGYYSFLDLKKGLYQLETMSYSSINQKLKNIELLEDESIKLNIYIKDNQTIRGCNFTICLPYFYFGNESKVSIKDEDIKIVTSDKLVEKALASSSKIKVVDNKAYVNGGRENNIDYYIDGVKLLSNPGLPRTSVRQINYYLGGVPAKFGDRTSGVVSISTKGYFDLYYEWKSRQ